MKFLKLSLLVFLLSFPAWSRSRLTGYCENGGVQVSTLTALSTTLVQGSYPSCNVTVYLTGGATGFVNTSGTAVSWVSGQTFNTTGTWNGLTIVINSISYVISSCASTTACTITTSAGTQSGVAYSISLAPAAIYSDNSGTVLANPFTASSVGQWGFYADDGAYDVRFSGSTLPAPFTITGNSLYDGVPVSQGTSGTIPRTAKAKLGDFLNVTDFGADPTGGLDSTAAINLAINQSQVGKGPTPGVCIFFPDGIYKITSGLSYNHTICATGNQWRIKYTGASPITSVLAIIGDVNNVYGTHCSGQSASCYLEGSIVNGAILDGQGNATNGLTLQGVIGAQINYMRVTNVTGAGVNCNWCQQATFERLQVSQDYEAFTTVPVNGVIVDGISAANIFNQVNIDHVSGTGIVLKWALNTLIHGGTSEGNGGYGVSCTSGTSPFFQCFNNMFQQFDTEVNTSGDYLFGDVGGGVFDNSVFESNSFSVPGYTFTGSAHANTVIGGSIGCGSIAGAQTINNYIRGVAASCSSGPVWVDSGQNDVGRIYNQANGVYLEPINNNNKESIIDNVPGGLRIDFYTPNTATAELTVGGSSTNNFIGFNQQSGLVPWLIFPAAGVQFISESGFRTGAIPELAIVNHRWGFGRFNTAPSSGTVNTQDSVATTVVDQAGPGQGGTDLHQFMGFLTAQGTVGTILSRVDNLGDFVGPVIHRLAGGTVATVSQLPTCSSTTEGMLIPVSDSTTQTWGATITGGSTLHALAYCDGSGNYTVAAK